MIAATAVAVACAGSAAGSTVGAARVIAFGSSPDAVALGDVTGDGRKDVVLTTGYANDPTRDFHVVVFAQQADGTLAAPSGTRRQEPTATAPSPSPSATSPGTARPTSSSA